jgi:hypothetical protein
MLLTFTVPKFEQLIKDQVKVHTIRTDQHNRWKVGMKIHFWMGNPRNTRGKIKPYQFGTGKVERIDSIVINPNADLVIINGYEFKHAQSLKDIARNDGFDSWQEMKSFFANDQVFVGKLIFWEDCVWEHK